MGSRAANDEPIMTSASAMVVIFSHSSSLRNSALCHLQGKRTAQKLCALLKVGGRVRDMRSVIWTCLQLLLATNMVRVLSLVFVLSCVGRRAPPGQ